MSEGACRAFEDDRSVGSAKSNKPVLAQQLFFQNAAGKVVVPIGESSVSGDYPLCDPAWTFWITTQNTT